MGRNHNILSFGMDDSLLRFDLETSILLCQSKENGKKQWVKKLNDLNVSDIFEDNKRYYIVCDSGEINGQFLAVKKENGTTSWFIPGKSFLHVLYKGFLFLIFADEANRFYLLKVNIGSGKSVWFHPIDADLFEYIFSNDKIKLKYFSGKTESLALKTGKLIN
jgi:outer membrane protein assembly factor BamB